MEEELIFIRKSGRVGFLKFGEEEPYKILNSGIESSSYIESVGKNKLLIIKDNLIYICEISENKEDDLQILQKVEGHEVSVYCYLQCEENLILTGGLDSYVKIWNLEGEKLVCEKEYEHKDEVYGIAVMNGFEELVSCSYVSATTSDGESIFVRNLRNDKVIKSFRGHVGPVNCCSKTVDEKILLTGGSEGSIHFWDRKCGYAKAGSVKVDDFVDFVVTISPNYFISSDYSPAVSLWDFRKRDNPVEKIDDYEVLKMYKFRQENEFTCVWFDKEKEISQIQVRRVKGGKSEMVKYFGVGDAKLNKIYDCCRYSSNYFYNLMLYKRDTKERIRFVSKEEDFSVKFSIILKEKEKIECLLITLIN